MNTLQQHKIDERETVKIPVGELRVGMFVSELDRPWLETPFLLQGFELKTEQDILAVQAVCEYVYIDTVRSRIVSYGLPGIKAGQSPPGHRAKPEGGFERELGKAGAAQRETSGLVKRFIDDIRLGHSVDIQVARAAVSECVSSILRNSEAMMFLTQIKTRDEYTSQHSFNVCVYAITLGRQAGLQPRELENIGLCGLLHDMGKVRIPLEVLNKEGKLTPEEFAIMKTHARHGRDILMSGRNIYSGTVDVAFGHHENLDGTGYPRSLDGSQLNLYTKIVSIVDKYDAITSNRSYQRGRSHIEAIKILNDLAKDKIDPQLAVGFISCLGVYPAGSVVELTTGEVGVVIEQNPRSRLRPRIVICRDAGKNRVPVRFLDLSEREHDDQGRLFAIRTLHPPDAFGIDLRQFQDLMEKRVW